jgi:flagellar motility protein MotE (MotC chaperone)
MGALLLVKSAELVRAAVPAPAQAAPGPAASVPPVSGKSVSATTNSVPPAPPAAPVDASERALLLDLRRRSAQLDAREAGLVARQNVLAAAEKRLVERADELARLQTRLEGLDKARHDREEANWAGLTKLYESMKPADAAAIFDDLDMPVLLQLVDRMKPAKAAPVLAAMQPERARVLTAELARLRARRDASPKLGG